MVTIEFDKQSNEILKIENNVEFDHDKMPIADFKTHYLSGNLELNPVFQRKSVWNQKQRKNLIKSLYENIPIPSVFLYKRFKNGKIIYDVIDGKQRLETIFMFLGLKGFTKQKFSFKVPYFDSETGEHEFTAYWDDLDVIEQERFLNYQLNIITVSGNFTDISEIFVRINSTGSSLSRQEIRDAKFINSTFLQYMNALANKKIIIEFFETNRIISSKQILRRKHVEFVSELVLSIHHQRPLDKKQVIDNTMESGILNARQLAKSKNQFEDTLKTIKKIFPELRSTRFNGLADFYTLFLLVWKWKYINKYTLSNNRVNKLINAYLVAFSDQCDRINKAFNRLESLELENNEIYKSYLLTVKSSTDSKNQRDKREEILSEVLNSTFERKDPFRNFNKEQRRLLWNNSNKKCAICNKKLTFSNFHADHVKPHSKGGKTILSNAQVLCAEHNIKKSNK